MLTLVDGNVLLNGSICTNPELIYLTLKDLAETGNYELK